MSIITKTPIGFANASRYDKYDRKGPKVLPANMPARSSPGKANNFRSALSEACFMTGLERNADVVRLATCSCLLMWMPGNGIPI